MVNFLLNEIFLIIKNNRRLRYVIICIRIYMLYYFRIELNKILVFWKVFFDGLNHIMNVIFSILSYIVLFLSTSSRWDIIESDLICFFPLLNVIWIVERSLNRTDLIWIDLHLNGTLGVHFLIDHIQLQMITGIEVFPLILMPHLQFILWMIFSYHYLSNTN